MVVDNDYDLDDGSWGGSSTARRTATSSTRAPIRDGAFVVPPSWPRRALGRARGHRRLHGLEQDAVGPLHHEWDPRVQGFFYWFFYQQAAAADRRWRPVPMGLRLERASTRAHVPGEQRGPVPRLLPWAAYKIPGRALQQYACCF